MIPYIITAAACAWAIYQTVMNRVLVRDGNEWRSQCQYAIQNTDMALNRLTALRQRCFITNERGHRVRYIKASPEARAKAEQV